MWGRREHLAATRRAGYLAGINAAAEAVAVGHSPPAMIDDVCERLTHLLSLRSCTFQYGVAGLGRPARSQHDGRVTAGDVNWDVGNNGLPTQVDTELLVESGGILRGRFLFRPEPDSRPTLEQRLVAIALADQIGAALTASQPAGPR